VNGRRAEASDPLYASDVVASMNGSDVVEPVDTRREEIAPPVRYQGDGPVMTVLEPGAPGLREVVVGRISKEVVVERVLKEPTLRVVKRTAPPKGAKLVALTFDDGPWPGSTEKILQILKQNDVTATFFMIAGQAERRPALARAVAEAGMTVANHSLTHPMMSRMSFSRVSQQILNANRAIEKATRQRPKYFRPPGGSISPHMEPILAKQGMKMVLWDVDTLDWQKPPVTSILDRVRKGARPGSVILMHDGGGDRSKTVEALPYVIQMLRKEGFYFVTLDALPARGGIIR
jgi:peptidoglycan/xylan/chitin deacetylase (PgdA/CDA1 family)